MMGDPSIAAGALSAEVESIERQLERLKAKASGAESRLNAAREEVQKKRAYNARANAGIEKLLALIDTNGKRSEVDSLLPLVRRKASLVAEEKAFKASCKAKRIQLEQEIEDLKANPPEPGGGGRAEEQEAARKDAVTERDSLKHQLGKKLRVVSLLTRKLDEIPSGPELMQYEKRFVELYEQVQRKLQETRRFYNTYNVLTDTGKFTQKESSLLNSIDSQFEQAISFPAGRAKLVESMEGIASSVKQTLSKATRRLEEDRQSLGALQATHAQLLAAERLYYSRVKEFQSACDQNEELKKRIHELGEAQAADSSPGTGKNHH